jgi:hypothetical protein
MFLISSYLFHVTCEFSADTYPGFGFTGGADGSKINKARANPFLPNGRLKEDSLIPYARESFEELDPNYIANRGSNTNPDNLISRSNLHTKPTPDSVHERLLEKNDHTDASPFDFTKGFVSGLNDHGLTESGDNLNAASELLGTSQEFDPPKIGQALIMDPNDPTANAIVDLPRKNNYYPWNNPYNVVESEEPIKLKKKSTLSNANDESVSSEEEH